ncbi:MAG: adenosylcobalamin-dependent ribonucleoside-diphosphate reductase [Planctomycetes bacterium]|nr:adenosylcobalamin-dependent ribonucleoside-diphosphate reductase [Planctomycetota bacterium]
MSLRDELLRRRYLLKDVQGRVVETPPQMFTRVAGAVAGVEAEYDATPDQIRDLAAQFFRLMSQGRFLPNSPTLMNAGREDGVCAACFVLPVEDSIEDIFDAVKQTALVQKAGGGTGFAFDALRPTGDLVASSGGKTSGPISFMRVFSETTMAIQQGAHRRGANMAMMSIKHPDILNFIHAKDDQAEFANFNLSVKVTNSFMMALEESPDGPHIVINPRTGQRYMIPRRVGPSGYSLPDLVPAGRVTVPCFSRRDLWNMIVANAHATGEPGISFIDRVNADNPTPKLGRIEATNPCGEQPLLANEACNLGSINLSRFVDRKQGDIDWNGLGDVVSVAMRFLDNVIDLTCYPTAPIQECSLGNRKIGLGVMGFADALALLGMRYDSEAALGLASGIGRFIQDHTHEVSAQLAKERGRFPNWDGSRWDTEAGVPMRNATVTTIAPTGSISILTGCSSGIEPIYSLAYRRRALEGEEFVQVHPLLERIGRSGGWMNDSVRQALLEGTPATQIPAIPSGVAEILVTAHEVTPEWHVRMQAAFQQHVDNAVSKTVNLPSDATVADVDRVFRLAFELGCKGITVYRNGARSGQTLSAVSDEVAIVRGNGSAPRARIRITIGQTFKYRMGCGTLFVTVNRDEQGLCEVFANLGKAGGCPSQSEATCRAVSTALRSGVSPKELIEQLQGIRCLSTAAARKGNSTIKVLSCPDAIARAIEETCGGAKGLPHGTQLRGRHCPFCGHAMRREAGCFVCDSCLHNSCG